MSIKTIEGDITNLPEDINVIMHCCNTLNNMSIKTIEGDITDLPEDINVIMHCCNTLNVMGSGVALALADTWREVRRADNNAAANGINALGSLSLAQIGAADPNTIPPLLVFNLYAQGNVGSTRRQLNYEAMARALEEAVGVLTELLQYHGEHTFKIGIPYLMGCDRAGGNWGIVSAMVEHYLIHYEVIYIKYNKQDQYK